MGITLWKPVFYGDSKPSKLPTFDNSPFSNLSRKVNWTSHRYRNVSRTVVCKIKQLEAV